MARLKVFSWSDGFHRYTVAASSMPKALAAWGIKADIFKSGLAEEITDGPDYQAALDAPEQVIERGLSVDVGKTGKARRSPRPSSAARKRVETLEAELEALDHDQAAAMETMEQRLAALEREVRDLAEAQAKARSALVKRLKAARDKV